jgi:glycosyltransferase involved in cell wall biosynthesis
MGLLSCKNRRHAAAANGETMTSAYRPYRLAVVASHPIQYQAPLFRALAARPEIDLTVLFCCDWGLKSYDDKGFGRELKWDVPLLDGYRSEFLPNVSPKPSPSRFWGLINPGVVRRLRAGGFDALWVHGWAKFTDWLAMLTAFASGVPVLLRGETTLLPRLPAWKAMAKRAILTQLFHRVSAFLAIGRYNAEFYRAYGVPKEKIFHVPYTVDNDFFLAQAERYLPEKIALKRMVGIPDDLPVILFCGKLTAVKRPMDLLKAFGEVSRTRRAGLIYVGDGPLRPQLEAYAREQHLQDVYFMGFQNQTKLPRFYAVADVFVLPSGFEPWGLVVNEAMCFGLPVIVSDQVGAGGDLVQNGVNGFTYSVGEVAILAEQVAVLLTETTLAGKMGQGSHELITRWSQREAVQGILACLEHL